MQCGKHDCIANPNLVPGFFGSSSSPPALRRTLDNLGPRLPNAGAVAKQHSCPNPSCCLRTPELETEGTSSALGWLTLHLALESHGDKKTPPDALHTELTSDAITTNPNQLNSAPKFRLPKPLGFRNFPHEPTCNYNSVLSPSWDGPNSRDFFVAMILKASPMSSCEAMVGGKV